MAKTIETGKTKQKDWNRVVYTTVYDEVIGKTIESYEKGQFNDNNDGDDYLLFKFTDGTSLLFYHEQDCCEFVFIDDICGDLDDLVGSPLVTCECVQNFDNVREAEYDDYWTWTFYHFATEKGRVDVKWYGTSNGYYSEKVDSCYTDENGDEHIIGDYRERYTLHEIKEKLNMEEIDND